MFLPECRPVTFSFFFKCSFQTAAGPQALQLHSQKLKESQQTALLKPHLHFGGAQLLEGHGQTRKPKLYGFIFISVRIFL